MRRYLEAAQLAERAGDANTVATVSGNIANIYSDLGEVASAIDSAENGIAHSARSRPYYLLQLRTTAASLHARAGDMKTAVPELRRIAAKAAENWRTAGDELERQTYARTLTLALQHLGFHLLRAGDLRGAEEAVEQGLKARRSIGGRGVQFSYLNLGMIREAQGQQAGAAALYESALEAARRSGDAIALWKALYRRGHMRAAQSRWEDAVRDLGAAVELVRRWRLQVLPADPVRMGADIELQDLYASFAESLAELHFQTGRSELIAQSVQVLEENRAASLRASTTTLAGWENRVPPEYGETLARLQGVEAKLLAGDTPELRRDRDRLRARLVQLETAAGLGEAAVPPGQAGLVAKLRNALRPSEMLVSFHLGERSGYVWTVCSHGMTLQRLPRRKAVTRLARKFYEAIRLESPAARQAGAELYRMLFAGAAPELARHSDILLSLDPALFAVPFAALVERVRNGRPVYLVETHTACILPSAGMLQAPRTGPRNGAFLGIGDPVYNVADSRWRGAPGAGRETPFLPRLPGSRREIRGCARIWSSEPGTLLEGPHAGIRQLRAAMANKPAVCHFAVHIVRGERERDSGVIALSLGTNGQRELLTAEEIASWRVRARIVALSGCSSGRDAALPGAGLIGLTRAWLAAGATTVVASLWPTPDDSGELFRSFYEYLRTDPLQSAAAALRSAQCASRNSGTWRAHPKYWAAYFLIARGRG